MQIRIGFIGLGLMGRPMAIRLLRAGYPVTVWNRTFAKTEGMIDEGAVVAASPKAVAKDADLIITIVTGPEALEAVLAGPAGVFASLASGTSIIEMSTIGLDAVHAWAKVAQAKGIDFLDAPVTGSVPGAESGTLTIMVGGARETFDRYGEILRVLGEPLYVGSRGMGALVKLTQNLITAALVEGLAEAVHLAESHGLDRATVARVLQHTGVASTFLKMKVEKMVKQDYRPQFSLANMTKDVGLALAAAGKGAVTLPLAEQLHRIYQQGVDMGFGEDDYAVLAQCRR